MTFKSKLTKVGNAVADANLRGAGKSIAKVPGAVKGVPTKVHQVRLARAVQLLDEDKQAAIVETAKVWAPPAI